MGVEAPLAKATYRTYGDLIAQAPPFKQKMYDLTQNQTEETCLRLYKSISGALFVSAARLVSIAAVLWVWFHVRGRGIKKSRASHALIVT